MKKNPFDPGSDEAHIWEMLVTRDIEAFTRADWRLVEDDFPETGFHGIHGHLSNDVDDWKPRFPNLGAYRNEWLKQAREMREAVTDPGKLSDELHALTTLEQIDVDGETAVAHKKFDGVVSKKDGRQEALLWQTLYVCGKTNGKWRIHSFVGYLPYDAKTGTGEGVIQHPQTSQHKTAGPYSPVVRIDGAASIVVLSGQAPVNDDGDVVGETLEEQARATLRNCSRQLAAAGAGLEDVFKVMVYLTDLSEWESFNEVYRELMPAPYPARTAVEAVLLPGFKVEVDMWAAVE